MNRIKIILLFIITCFITVVYPQKSTVTQERQNNDFNKITDLYLAGHLNDVVYLRMVDSLAALALDNGVFYSTNEMPKNLKQFEKIAWSKKTYGDYRNDYYIILLNNAYLSSQWGASMYYAEKITRQNEKDGTPRSFIELSVKMHIYKLTNRDEKIIETYKKHQNLFESLLKNIENNPNDYYWDAMDAIRILSSPIETYFRRKEMLEAEKAYQISISLFKNMVKAQSFLDTSKQTAEFYITSFGFYKARSLEKNDEALAYLNKIHKWVKTNKEVEKEYRYSLLDLKVQFFLDMMETDSASYYINEIENSPKFVQDQLILINRYKARLENLKGNAQKASRFLNDALEESSKVQGEMAEEMDHLLYAQTKAEHHKLALERSEEDKRKKNNWIFSIGALLILIITCTIILLRLKDKKLKKIIKDLNETADIQIAVMKQFEFKIRKEEQERISQNLHDDLAGTLAAIKNNIDLQIIESEENENKEKLIHLSEMFRGVFHNVRNTSHELFERAQLPDEEMFCQHITHLAQIAFPDKHYKLNIQIDEFSLEDTSIEFRSELIRVIQEAFTNIIKHAEATQVALLIYKETDKLFIIIKDNGKGLQVNMKKNTLGIRSMKNRLSKYDAYFSIDDHDGGVEIIITIPENTTKRVS